MYSSCFSLITWSLGTIKQVLFLYCSCPQHYDKMCAIYWYCNYFKFYDEIKLATLSVCLCYTKMFNYYVTLHGSDQRNITWNKITTFYMPQEGKVFTNFIWITTVYVCSWFKSLTARTCDYEWLLVMLDFIGQRSSNSDLQMKIDECNFLVKY